MKQPDNKTQKIFYFSLIAWTHNQIFLHFGLWPPDQQWVAKAGLKPSRIKPGFTLWQTRGQSALSPALGCLARGQGTAESLVAACCLGAPGRGAECGHACSRAYALCPPPCRQSGNAGLEVSPKPLAYWSAGLVLKSFDGPCAGLESTETTMGKATQNK